MDIQVPLSARHHRPRHGLGPRLPCKQVTATWGMGCGPARGGGTPAASMEASPRPSHPTPLTRSRGRQRRRRAHLPKYCHVGMLQRHVRLPEKEKMSSFLFTFDAPATRTFASQPELAHPRRVGWGERAAKSASSPRGARSHTAASWDRTYRCVFVPGAHTAAPEPPSRSSVIARG